MLIRQNAFDGKERMLKGALHCHTTRSDGDGTPEEVIRLHVSKGYDFLAITDHRRYNYKNFAPDTDITIIPGMEYDSTFERGLGFRCFHIVCLGPDDETNGFAQDQYFESGHSTCQEDFQPYLDWLHKNGQMTIYAHPEWSSTPTKYFDRLRGNFAMEVWNTGCAEEGNEDMNAPYWDEILGEGQPVFGVATDDGHPMRQHCRGWVMVRAKSRSVKDILAALREGAFYASTGPVIHDFYVEDGIAHIQCDPAAWIEFSSDMHPTRRIRGEEGKTVTEASYDLSRYGGYRYVRASVVGENGLRAWTNPIFLPEYKELETAYEDSFR